MFVNVWPSLEPIHKMYYTMVLKLWKEWKLKKYLPIDIWVWIDDPSLNIWNPEGSAGLLLKKQSQNTAVRDLFRPLSSRFWIMGMFCSALPRLDSVYHRDLRSILSAFKASLSLRRQRHRLDLIYRAILGKLPFPLLLVSQGMVLRTLWLQEHVKLV